MTAARRSPLADLRSAACSDGAPSARNLIVTVFGDALLPHGTDTVASVKSLTALLSTFDVNERLIRTSLTRLVNEALLTTTITGRRSYYGVAPGALDLFHQADRRIYRGVPNDWDGAWTIVVIDGGESTPRRRARLRQELAWLGLGPVAPNVMASPIVTADAAASAVAHVGGLHNVLVSRSRVVEAGATIGVDELTRRVAPLDEIAGRYADVLARFGHFDADELAALTPELAFKLRTLLVSEFRRVVLHDPQLPATLLPDDWVGHRARAVAGRVYDAIAASSEAFLAATVDPPLVGIGAGAGRFGN